MPILGLAHHAMFKKTGERSIWGLGHMWLGRVMILLGIINGGLGIQLSGGPSWAIPAYSVVAAVFVVAWIGAIVYSGRKKGGAVKEEKS